MKTQGTDDHAMSDTTFSNPVIRWIDYRLPVFTLLHHELHDCRTPRNDHRAFHYVWILWIAIEPGLDSRFSASRSPPFRPFLMFTFRQFGWNEIPDWRRNSKLGKPP